MFSVKKGRSGTALRYDCPDGKKKKKKKDKLMWIQKFTEDLRKTTLRTEFCAWE